MLVCPSCGRENPTDARFCNACGTDLATAATATRQVRKTVTVLFADVVGSTALADGGDPEAIRVRMQAYFDDLRQVVERHGGTVEKFVGDAVMAVFGIPDAHEDDALRALRAAVEMREATARHGLEARIGLNSGEVVTGEGRDTLVTGDAVNVAARLEQSAAPGEILIGAATRELAGANARVADPTPLTVRGKSEPVEAYRLLDVDAVVQAPRRRPDAPLIGRERERRRLWRDFEDVVAERSCRLFTLLGPAGIGKSRLVADFLERVGDTADVLRGRCLPYGEGIVYWPVAEILVEAGVDPADVIGSSPAETRVAFRRVLDSRASVHPQVVVFDDIQWAEPHLLELIEHVADHSRDAPILIVCIARDELLEKDPGWGGGKVNATSLRLGPLDDAEREELVADLLEGADLPAQARERIADLSEGNPLYAEEMVAMARDHGISETAAVPPTIQALLQARLDGLERDDRTILTCASVEGQVFHLGALAALIPDDLRPTLDDRLSDLLRRDLIRPDVSMLQGEEALRFRHLLLHDAAYAALPKAERAALHERFARWLEDAEDRSPFALDEILGFHLEQAYLFREEVGIQAEAQTDLGARAAARLIGAGQAALWRGEPLAAGGFLDRGVRLLPRDDPARREALPDLAAALRRQGELARAEDVATEALQLARDAGDRRTAVLASLELADLRSRTDPNYRGEDELATTVALAREVESTGDLAVESRVIRRLGLGRFMLGHAAEGAADLERAVALAAQAGDRVKERDAISGLLRPTMWGPAPAAEGLALCRRILDADYLSLELRVHALQARAFFAAMQGDRQTLDDSSTQALALLAEYGHSLQVGLTTCDIGYAHIIAGDLGQAERELRQSHDVLLGFGEVGTRCTVDGGLAGLLARQGREDEALEFVDEARRISSDDDWDAQPRWRIALALVLARRGGHTEAERLVRESMAMLEPCDFILLKAEVFDVLGEVLGAAGRLVEAEAAIQRAIELHEAKGNVMSAVRSRTRLGELRVGSGS